MEEPITVGGTHKSVFVRAGVHNGTDKNRLVGATRHAHRHLWILLLAVLLMHVPALFHPFFLDDYVYVEKAHDLGWRNAAELFRSPTLDTSASGVWWAPSGTLPFYRPIGQLTFIADYSLWGLRPFGFYLTNLVLHWVCTLLTWRLARRLFEAPGHALAAAFVFAIHPVHGEAVTWISGRFDLLVCACTLASALSYLKWSDRSARGWGAFALFWFIAALGCKETALILPAVLVGIELLRAPDRPGRVRRVFAMIGAFGIVALLYLSGRFALFGGVFGKLPPPYGLDMSSPLIALKGIAWYSAQYLLDIALCIHIEPVYLPQFWLDHRFLYGAALAISVLLLAGAAIVGRSRVSCIGMTWLVMFTAPSLLSMPGERNFYLASVGLALFIAAVFRAVDTRGAATPQLANIPPTHPALRRISYFVVVLWLLICVVQQALLGRVTAASDKVYRDLEAILPDLPRDARIYVVHQNPFNSVGFAQAIRLRSGRSDLSGCALSLSPDLIATNTKDNIIPIGPDSIQLVREDGAFFSSFIERFHRFSEPVSTLGDACSRRGLDLLDPPTTYEKLAVLKFRLPYSLSDPRIEIFYWDNQRIRGRLELLQMGSRAELRLCKPTGPAIEPASTPK